MLNQTNQLQNRIDSGFVPIGLDMPYRIVVGNSPMNYIDPYGEFAFTPVIIVVFVGYGIMEGIELGVETYYDYKLLMQLENQINFIREQMKNPKCEIEQYGLLKKRLEELVLQQTKLGGSSGVKIYGETIKVITKAR